MDERKKNNFNQKARATEIENSQEHRIVIFNTKLVCKLCTKASFAKSGTKLTFRGLTMPEPGMANIACTVVCQTL